MSLEVLSEYMSECRALVLAEMRQMVPDDSRYNGMLYDLVLEYPLREAKALRPALCVATCRALGGSLYSVTSSATVLELYHNAFLVHDDIEDGSELRRDGPTLHREHGVPVAVNVGDAMLALALEPLLDNMRVLSLGKALRILQAISRMARESAEGQALELSWIRGVCWLLADRDYFRLVHKKTSHYTFLAPTAIGGICAGASSEQLTRFRFFSTALGVAFQIQDDVLNLTGKEARVGKEIDGDLWEGKHTLVLLHAIRSASEQERRQALAALRKPRPFSRTAASPRRELEDLLRHLANSGDLSQNGREELSRAIGAAVPAAETKTDEDIDLLRELIRRHQSVDYAASIARRWARKARATLKGMHFVGPSVHRDFLHALTEFVVERDH